LPGLPSIFVGVLQLIGSNDMMAIESCEFTSSSLERLEHSADQQYRFGLGKSGSFDQHCSFPVRIEASATPTLVWQIGYNVSAIREVRVGPYGIIFRIVDVFFSPRSFLSCTNVAIKTSSFYKASH